MKNYRYALTLLAALAAFLLPLGSLLAADIVGSATDPANPNGISITVGESQIDAGPHKSGYAGIGVSSYVDNVASIIDFDGIAQYSIKTDLGNNLKRHIFNAGPTLHGGLGNFDFVRVAQRDVWFGTWNDGSAGGNYQAYYVGNRAGTTLPASQTATYSVKGLNNSNVLTGTFSANFGTKKLLGALSGGGVAISVNANINSSNASFNGGAIANGVNGATKGHFFGANAASLAGIAEFANNKSLNTAFGGTKN